MCAPQVLAVLGITDDYCFLGFCNDCVWFGPTRPIFEEADDDVENHIADVEDAML